jgi:hypothetical protein
MSTFVLFSIALAAAFAVAVALRSNAEVEVLLKDVRRLTTKLDSAEADLSTLRQRLHNVEGGASELEAVGPGHTVPSNGSDHADPRVYVQLVPDQPHDRVILSNRSGVAAQNVSLHLEFDSGRTPFLPEFGDTNFPVPLLQQGVPYIVLADFRAGCDGPVPARLEWRDPDGTTQVREFPLRW